MSQEGARWTVQYSAGGVPALRGGICQYCPRVEGRGNQEDGRTAFTVFLSDNFELARSVPLHPLLNPGEPCV
jgi:hypothetical protein